MFDAARLMAGESPPRKEKCIIGYEAENKRYKLTLMDYSTKRVSELTISNWMFDNGLSISDISDTKLVEQDNSCWHIEFGIHNRDNVEDIVEWKSLTFIDNRLWVSDMKVLQRTGWKHPFTEMYNGQFNARSGLCVNTMDIVRKLIVVGSSMSNNNPYSITKINRHGFMQVETDDGLIVQHLNNFDDVNPDDINGIWFNDQFGLWVFENSDEVNKVPECGVYLLLDTHARQPRFYNRAAGAQIYTYDYTKALAFFSDSEAVKYAKELNRRLRTSFTAEQWI